MEELQKLAKKQLFFTKVTCTLAVIIGAAVLIFLVVMVPQITSVMEKTDSVLEKTDAILEEVDVDAIDELNETVKTLNQAVAPLKNIGSLFGTNKEDSEDAQQQ